jgi:hypothetical protein
MRQPEFSNFTMRAFVFVCIAVAAAFAEAKADPYTIAQVNAGVPALRAALSGQPGVITGISYGNGLVQGHLGNAAHYNVGPYTYNAAPVAAYSTGYVSPYSYSGYHHLGKREAEADADADAYTIGQVAAGLPYANAVATGHAHNPGYVAYTSYPHISVYSGYHVAPAVSYAAPVVSSYGAYAGSPYIHSLGKREADADAYTIGQVAAGLPFANAVATGHAHNPGYVAYTSYPTNAAYSTYHAAPVVQHPYTAYSGYAAPFYG